MIRPLTCICMLAAAAAGLYLYQTKHRAQLLDREIARTLKQIDLTRDRITALKSERAQLSDPDRLKDLAATHLPLKTLAPTQFVALADLGARLPPPVAPGSLLLPDDPMPAGAPAPVVAARPPARGPADRVVADRSTAEKPVERPMQVAALPQPQAAPSPAASTPLAVPPVAPPARAPAPRAVPAAIPAPMPAPVPAPAALPHPAPAAPHFMAPVMSVGVAAIQPQPAPGSIGESVARAARAREAARHREPAPVFVSAAPQATPPAATPVSAQIATVSVPMPYAGAGSALGSAGRVALPPPVPFAAGAR